MLGSIARAEQARVTGHSPPLAFSMCEVFLDPPDHLGGKGARIAWHCVVKNGHTRFETSEADDVAFKVVADYQAILPMARIDTEASPDGAARIMELYQAAAAAGKLAWVGVRASEAGQGGVESVHNEIARLTI